MQRQLQLQLMLRLGCGVVELGFDNIDQLSLTEGHRHEDEDQVDTIHDPTIGGSGCLV